MLLHKINSEWTEWNGAPINGVRHPRSIEGIWSDAELNVIGLFRPVGEAPTEYHTPAGFDDTAATPEQQFSAPDLESVKAQLKRQIDATAESIRLRHITPGDGQMLSYQEKAKEAHAFKRDPSVGQFPILQSSVGIEGDNLDAVATLVLQREAQWVQIEAAINKGRLGTKAAIDAATTIEEVQAAFDAIEWPASP